MNDEPLDTRVLIVVTSHDEVDEETPTDLRLETRLRELGAEFVAKEPWSDHVEIDETWITGQNPQSSASVAEEVVHEIQERKTVGVGSGRP